MHVELLKEYGITTMLALENIEAGPASRGDIWLLDPAVLLDEDKVAIIRQVLGNDLLPERLEAACEAARAWAAEQP